MLTRRGYLRSSGSYNDTTLRITDEYSCYARMRAGRGNFADEGETTVATVSLRVIASTFKGVEAKKLSYIGNARSKDLIFFIILRPDVCGPSDEILLDD